VLPFYAIPTKADEAKIWEIMRSRSKDEYAPAHSVPDDERVEDAGLAEAA
jgi:hypothetical protein